MAPPMPDTRPQFITDAETQQKIDIAVSRERERCAQIADGFFGLSTPIGPLFGAGCSAAAEQIAAKIREGALANVPPQAATKGLE